MNARNVKDAKVHMNDEWRRYCDSSKYHRSKSLAFYNNLLLETKDKFKLDNSFTHSKKSVIDACDRAKKKEQIVSGNVVVSPNSDDVLLGEHGIKNETHNRYKAKCQDILDEYEHAGKTRRLELLKEVQGAFTRFLQWDNVNKQYCEIEDDKLVIIKIRNYLKGLVDVSKKTRERAGVKIADVTHQKPMIHEEVEIPHDTSPVSQIVSIILNY